MKKHFYAPDERARKRLLTRKNRYEALCRLCGIEPYTGVLPFCQNCKSTTFELLEIHHHKRKLKDDGGHDKFNSRAMVNKIRRGEIKPGELLVLCTICHRSHHDSLREKGNGLRRS